MLRKSLVIIPILVVIFAFSSCGGGGTVSDVCSAIAAKVFDSCDKSDPDDVQIIINAYAGFGETITEEDVAASTEGSLKEDCVNDLNEAEVEITSEQAKALEAGLEQLPDDCAAVAAFITGAF